MTSIDHDRLLRAADLRRMHYLTDTEADDDTPVPAPTGAHWGPRPAQVPVLERIVLQLPPDVPALTIPEQIEAARTAAYSQGVRDTAERRCWWDMFVGAVWGVVLGLLFALLGAWVGWLAVPDTGTAAPAAPAVNRIALATLALAAVPSRRRTPLWWTEAPHRACEVCTHGQAGQQAQRMCAQPEVVRYSSGEPVPVSMARAADGMCGTDARHHTLA